MPIISDLELPIRQAPISGPGVDMLERRKEDNNHPPIVGHELIENFRSVRSDLMSGLRSLFSQR